MRAFSSLQLKSWQVRTGEFPVCIPRIHTLKPAPQCDGIRRWGLWEGIGSPAGSPMMGLPGDPRELPPTPQSAP